MVIKQFADGSSYNLEIWSIYFITNSNVTCKSVVSRFGKAL